MLQKLSYLCLPLLCLGGILDLHEISDIMRDRTKEMEKVSSVGGHLWLTQDEEKANLILMHAKRDEIAKGMQDPDKYPPAMHFFHRKQYLKESKVFHMIQKMPKGALLHGHNKAMVTSKWIISNLTYDKELFTCRNANDVFIFTFNDKICKTKAIEVYKDRLKAKDKKKFDLQLEKHINMYTSKPEALHPNKSQIWDKFEKTFITLNGFFDNPLTFTKFHNQLLEELYKDNIMYAEVRVLLGPFSGGGNIILTSLQVTTQLEIIVQTFKLLHPDFIGLKVIYATPNKLSLAELAICLADFRVVHWAKPNFVIGFDLTGNEDTGDPLRKFAWEFSHFPNTAKFFFHAGMTNWNGRTDWNVMDAVLLNTKRIGHGFALPKHPELWAAIKKLDIAVEVNPISNQVLGFVWDLRNHPASFLIAENFPIVISSDNPGFRGAKGLTFDFYYAFMALAPADADLRFLKQLALNSIKHSVLTSAERSKFNQVFKRKWNKFIAAILALQI